MNMKITYMRTLDAALFSTNPLCLMFLEVSSKSMERFPPDFMPEMIKKTVFSIFSLPILLAMSLSEFSSVLPVAMSFPTMSISLSSGSNSGLELSSIALSTVIPARKLLAINCRKSGNTPSVFLILSTLFRTFLR